MRIGPISIENMKKAVKVITANKTLENKINTCIHDFEIDSIQVQFKKNIFRKKIYILDTYFLYKCNICNGIYNGDFGKEILYMALSINDDKQFLNWVYRNFEKENIEGELSMTYISFNIRDWIFNNKAVFDILKDKEDIFYGN